MSQSTTSTSTKLTFSEYLFYQREPDVVEDLMREE
jgi:hypothetical protein